MKEHVSRPSLPVHEWIAVVFFLSILVTLAVISHCQIFSHALTTSSPHYITPQHIEVTIKGAVENPGTYLLEKDAAIEDIFLKAKPLPNADTRRYKVQSKLRDGQSLTIKAKSKPRKKEARK